MTSIKKLAYRGAFWTIGGFGFSYGLRFFNNVILARLLGPEPFGLMLVVNTLLIGLELFSDVGIGQSIISNSKGEEPVFLNTAWTIQIIRGFALWIICLIITVPAAHFYKDERLLWLLPFVGFSSVLSGLASTNLSVLNRQLALDKLMLFDLGAQVFSIGVMLVLAWYKASIWSLAIGGVSSHVFRLIVSHRLNNKFHNRICWDKEAVKQILSFGKWMFVATALMFLAEQADRLILAKLIGFTMLGVFNVAYTFAAIPREIIKKLGNRVIFPTISKYKDLPRSTLRSKILYQRRKILLGFALFLASLVSIGDLVIKTLYNYKYVQAMWMMPILCTGIWFSVLFYTNSPALLAIGKPLYSAQSNFARFLMISLGLPLAFNFTSSLGLTGTLGAIIVIALSDLPLYLVNIYGLGREKLLCLTQDLWATALFVGILIVLLLIRNHLGLGLPIQSIPGLT